VAESGASASVVEVRGVAKTYPNGTHALAPVDFDVRRGEFVTLLGPSGCGKTTLLNLIAGLISPSVGTLRWWNGDFAATGVPGKRFAFVFQSPTLMPWARVRGNVRLPLDLAHTDRSDAERAVDDVLSRVGLRDFGRILGKIAIDVPYPRPDDFRTSTVFASYAQHLSRLVAEAGAGAAPATTG